MKRFFSRLATVFALCALLLSAAGAADSGCTDLPKLDKYEIIELLRSPDLEDPQNYYEQAPSLTAPHTAGTVRQELLDSGLQRINVVRRLAGLPGVTMTDAYNLIAQKGSVVLAAGNQFTHWPEQPEGMDDAFFAEGYEATTHSNLAYYNSGSTSSSIKPMADPISSSIDGYMGDSDAYNLSAVGHRRWVLDPQMAAVGLGLAHTTYYDSPWYCIDVYSTMYWDTYAGPYTDYDFIAWPASGLFPNTNFIIDEAGNNAYRTPQSDAWSVSLNPKHYATPSVNDLTVTLTGPTGSWTFSGDQEYAIANAGLYFTVNTQYIGEGPCIIFRPAGIQKYEGEYTVSITGLKTSSGKSTSLEYSVEFFTPTCLDGHTFSEQTVPATCTTPGSIGQICSVCGYTLADEVIPALDHQWGIGVQKDDTYHTATCQRAGCGVTQDMPHIYGVSTLGDLSVTYCSNCDLDSAQLNIASLPGASLTASCLAYSDGVCLKLTNNGSAAVEATAYLAEYAADGRFLGCSSAPVSVPAGATDSQSLPLTNTGAHKAVVYVMDKDFSPLTQPAWYSPAAVEYKAWYEVDENGQLSIRTNIDASGWNGYTVKSKFLFQDGSQSNDFGTGAYAVNYGCSSMISYFSPGDQITRTEFLVFRDSSTMEEYWTLESQLGSQAAVLEALADKLVARFELGFPIVITETDTPFQLTDFTITYDEENQTETYTAKLDIPIVKAGSYGLNYQRKSGSGASLSAIHPRDGVLTFTRGMHHFGQAGDNGTFYITYCVYSTAPDGTIICTKARSSGFDYTFTH